MNNKIYFLAILLLLQSCNTYKILDLKAVKNTRPSKVKITLKSSNTYSGKIIRHTESEITLKNRIKTRIISIAEIDKIKGREFSLSKTILLSTAISATILIGLVHLLIEGVGEVPLTP